MLVSETSDRISAYLCELFIEAVDKPSKDIPCVADLFSIFTNNPYQRTSCIGFVQVIDTLAQSWNNTLVARILPKDIFDHNNCFLNDVVHFGRDQVQQGVDTLLGRSFNFDRDLADCFHGTPNEVHIDLLSVLLEFREKLIDVAVVCYPNHDLKLLKL